LQDDVFVANRNDSVDIGDTLDISKVRARPVVSIFGVINMCLFYRFCWPVPGKLLCWVTLR
jgi:hypothetical protein